MKLDLLPPKDDDGKGEWDRYYRIKKMVDFEWTLDDLATFYERARNRKGRSGLPEAIINEIRQSNGIAVL